MKPTRLRMLAFALAAACVTAAAAQTATAPSALGEAVAATTAAKADYAFDLETVSGAQNWRAHFDPNASPKLRLVSPSRDTLDEGARRQFDQLAESMEGVNWCANDAMSSAQNVRLLREDETSATYAFQPTAEMMRNGRGGPGARNNNQGAAFMRRVQGEFTITKDNPDITRMRIFIPQPFSPAPLVRMERMTFDIRCAVAPNGRRYAAETAMDFAGSALGRRFNQQSTQRATNLTAQ